MSFEEDIAKEYISYSIMNKAIDLKKTIPKSQSQKRFDGAITDINYIKDPKDLMGVCKEVESLLDRFGLKVDMKIDTRRSLTPNIQYTCILLSGFDIFVT